MLAPSHGDIALETEQLLQPLFDPTRLLQYLIQIQQRFHCIPAAALDTLQQRLNLSKVQIQSVISFYSFLSSDDQGDYRILFSDNITDRMGGSQLLFERLSSALKDQSVSIGFTSCTGLCDQGPGLLVNNHAINRLDATRVDQIVGLIEQRLPLSEWPSQLFLIEDNIQRRDIQLDSPSVEGDALRKALQLGAQQTLQTLQVSGLRGRGGAGFATAKKWQFCMQSPSTQRYVVCNADEGEPGTFKDRVLLNRFADAVIEGMTICARVITASQGFIYLRGEYLHLLEPLNARLQDRRELGLLGKNILGHEGFDFDIEIHLGAGAYICGEESALIESLEGKRGIPRVRPPFPVVSGYKNRPTVVNNVETFWSVSRILLNGSDWFIQQGTDKSRGTRLLSISGDCLRPGIYEYPFGTSLRTILQDCGGSDAQAVQMAGAAGELVLSRDFDRCMSFEDLSTGGSFMVFGPERDLMEVLHNFAEFFRHESCGFCTPCRVGTSLIADIIQRFKAGRGCSKDRMQLREIAALMQQSSFCGLGSSAPTSFLNALKHSPQLFEQRVASDSDDPLFDLDHALQEFDRLTASNSQEPERDA